MERYHQNGLQMRFNGVYSRYHLPKINNKGSVINPDEYKLVGTHWIALYMEQTNIFSILQAYDYSPMIHAYQ